MTEPPKENKEATPAPPANPQPPTAAQAKADGMRKRSKEYHSKTEILENKVADQEKRIQELTEHLKSHGTTAPEATTQSASTEHREPKQDEKLPTHYVKAWQRKCPTCGDDNPNYKDETECKACHAHLGSVETAKKLDVCPFCGKSEGARKI